MQWVYSPSCTHCDGIGSCWYGWEYWSKSTERERITYTQRSLAATSFLGTRSCLLMSHNNQPKWMLPGRAATTIFRTIFFTTVSCIPVSLFLLSIRPILSLSTLAHLPHWYNTIASHMMLDRWGGGARMSQNGKFTSLSLLLLSPGLLSMAYILS